MRLTRVTITGADDGVDPKALVDLSAEFPFVEWGLLRSLSHNEEKGHWTGTPRYPSPDWRENLGIAADSAKVRLNLAAHLCGDLSREVIAGWDGVADSCPLIYQRFQLNGFSEYRLPLLRAAKLHPKIEWILQVQNQAGLEQAEELARLHPNVSALIDKSGGRGVETSVWHGIPDNLHGRSGHAGGLTAENVVSRLSEMAKAGDTYAWADAESGARTDDRFDLVKVRRFLEASAPFVEVARG